MRTPDLNHEQPTEEFTPEDEVRVAELRRDPIVVEWRQLLNSGIMSQRLIDLNDSGLVKELQALERKRAATQTHQE